jgi:hypothetical protein
MSLDAKPEHIVGYEVGFEGEVAWEKPVVFPLSAIDRIDRTKDGRARFTIGRNILEPVEYVTKSSFDEIVERIGAVH